MTLAILCGLPTVPFLRYVTIVLCIASTGCSAALYGIRPDPNDFRAEGLEYCRLIHTISKERNACADYENVTRRAQALEKAYVTLERVNRWGIFVGTTIALASVGALAGLYAFGQAGSHYAKIIPFAGTFVGSVIAALSNDVKADAYEDARYEMGEARALAEATVLPTNAIGRAASQYNHAQSVLNDKILTIEKDLANRIRAGRPSIKDLEQKTADLKKNNALLVFAIKYRVLDVQPDVASGPSKITITLTPNIEPDDQKLLADNGMVRIGEFDVKPSRDTINGTTVTIALPVSDKQPPRSGVYIVSMKIGTHLLTPTTTVTLNY